MSKETAAKYGAALSVAALTGSSASAAFVSLTVTPNVIPFTAYGSAVTLSDGITSIGSFLAYNFPVGKAALLNTAVQPDPLGGFITGAVTYGATISPGSATTSFGFFAPPSATGTYTFGFATIANQAGWIRYSFGGTNGADTILAAAFNDTPGGAIFAGQLAGPGPVPVIPESSTTIALAGLATLAAGVGVRHRRRKRAEAAEA